MDISDCIVWYANTSVKFSTSIPSYYSNSYTISLDLCFWTLLGVGFILENPMSWDFIFTKKKFCDVPYLVFDCGIVFIFNWFLLF